MTIARCGEEYNRAFLITKLSYAVGSLSNVTQHLEFQQTVLRLGLFIEFFCHGTPFVDRADVIFGEVISNCHENLNIGVFILSNIINLVWKLYTDIIKIAVTTDLKNSCGKRH